MNENAKTILSIIEGYLQKNPNVRFAQALFNLEINEFANKDNPEEKEFLLRDIYNDNDDVVLNRISNKK